MGPTESGVGTWSKRRTGAVGFMELCFTAVAWRLAVNMSIRECHLHLTLAPYPSCSRRWWSIWDSDVGESEIVLGRCLREDGHMLHKAATWAAQDKGKWRATLVFVLLGVFNMEMSRERQNSGEGI